MALLSRYTLPSLFDDDFYHIARSFFPVNYSSYGRARYRNISNDKTHLEVELAGYRKDQIEVYAEDGYLVISAKGEADDSTRSYKNSWVMDESAKVDKVRYDNGLLVVEMSRVVPPKPPRTTFDIT